MTLSPGSSRRGRVRQILQLRRAYDAADVDGDNALTLDEMEMFLLGLSPGASLEPAGVQHVWRCFNPQGKPSLNWQDFLHGMAAVRADPRAARLVDLGQPNVWAMVSPDEGDQRHAVVSFPVTIAICLSTRPGCAS